MSPDKTTQKKGLIAEVLKAFDDLNGLHPGFRPVHAKGLLLSGMFTPTLSGQALTRAPHLHRQQTPVTVRLSDFAGPCFDTRQRSGREPARIRHPVSSGGTRQHT